MARAYGAGKDWQAVLGVLATAEEACSSAAANAVATAAANDRGGERATAVSAIKHPPAELYEVVARSLALAGMWEEAASAVRRLEVIWYSPDVRVGRGFISDFFAHFLQLVFSCCGGFSSALADCCLRMRGCCVVVVVGGGDQPRGRSWRALYSTAILAGLLCSLV